MQLIRSIPCILFLSLLIGLSLPPSGRAQSPPKREFRAAWLATVDNLDWPVRGDSPQNQKNQLLALLDGMQASGINALIFQVRPECDALYASTYEPWSVSLTGTQGKAPVPFYDPLAYAVTEAHKRGMELHAWINPFRAEKSIGKYTLASNHVLVQHPDWGLSFVRIVNTDGTVTPALTILNPGLPEVREFVARVVADITRRYDIDGIHADDYFYPYPPQAISTQDAGTFSAYPRGFTNIGAWRRDNVNLLMKMITDSVNAIKPYVKVGVSPFGIWKNGMPSGITGLDAYGTIYGDAIAWLQQRTVDYLTPQLYWRIGGNQDYAKLMPWWADSCANNQRHFYPGQIFGSTYTVAELPAQLRLDRANPKTNGRVIFRASLLVAGQLNYSDSLERNYYTCPSLPPVMAWKDIVPPNPPRAIRFGPVAGTGASALQWDVPLTAADGDSANRYVIYRFDHVPAGSDLDDPSNILVVTPGRLYVPPVTPAGGAFYYCVTGLDHNNNEGDTSNVIRLEVPTPPVLIAPSFAGTGVTDSVRMTWSPTRPSSSYHIQVAKDSLVWAAPAVNDSTVADTSYAIAGLYGLTTYFWRVRAINAAGKSSFSTAGMFTTAFPTAPVPLSPPNLTVGLSPALTLRWAQAPVAMTYHAQLSVAIDFSTLETDTTGLADTSLSVSGLAWNKIYNWRVRASNGSGTGPWSPTFRFKTTVQTDVEVPSLPATFSLSQNFPNPFNPETHVRFAVPRESRVRITVFDVLGREQAVLIDSDLPAGVYTVRWDASGAASGMYILRMQAGDFAETRRMLLLR